MQRTPRTSIGTPILDALAKHKLKPIMEGMRDDNELYNEELPKRRNRKDCVHHGTVIHNSCTVPYLPHFCIGVNCGFFKTK
jgi:hypothetical protein